MRAKMLDESKREDYDDSAGKWRDTNLHAGWLDRLFKKHHVKTVLSLGCGTGTYEIALAKKGYEVLGMDYNFYMIRQAKEKAKRENVKIKFIKGDIKRFNYGKFDAVISIWAPIMFGCGNIDEVEKAVKCMKDSMHEQSVALVETPTPKIMDDFKETEVTNSGSKDYKKEITTVYKLDKKTNKCYLTYLIKTKKGSEEKKEIIKTTYNLYTKEQFEAIFDRLGLKVSEWYECFDDAKQKYIPYNDESKMISPLFMLR